MNVLYAFAFFKSSNLWFIFWLNSFPKLTPNWCQGLGRRSSSKGIGSKIHICLWIMITLAMTLIWYLTITLKFSRGSKIPQVGHRNQKNRTLGTSQELKPSILQVQTGKQPVLSSMLYWHQLPWPGLCYTKKLTTYDQLRNLEQAYQFLLFISYKMFALLYHKNYTIKQR